MEKIKKAQKWWNPRYLIIVFLDIIAVNLSYFLALLVRFYVNGEFRKTVSFYLTDFLKFVPFYTIVCIAVFAAFKLYSSMWKYASLNDMNRIVQGSVVASVLHVAGTWLFIRRMPISYYVIGAVFQLIAVAAIRFSIRIYKAEKSRIAGQKIPTENVIIVGIGETGRKMLRLLEEATDTPMKPVCMVDSYGNVNGLYLEGIPVVAGFDSLPDMIDKYHAESILVADPGLTAAARGEIKRIAAEKGKGFRDYTGTFANLTGVLPLTTLLEATKGPVELILEGKRLSFASGEEALANINGHYTVQSVFADGGKVSVSLDTKGVRLNDINTEWAKAYEQETGEEISFF